MVIVVVDKYKVKEHSIYIVRTNVKRPSTFHTTITPEYFNAGRTKEAKYLITATNDFLIAIYMMDVVSICKSQLYTQLAYVKKLTLHAIGAIQCVM